MRRLVPIVAGLLVLALLPATALARRPVDRLSILGARLAQRGAQLELTVVATSPWQPGDLDASGGVALCLRLSGPRQPDERVCLSRRRDVPLHRDVLGADGRVRSVFPLAGTVLRTAPSVAIVRFVAADAGLRAGVVRWSLLREAVHRPCPRSVCRALLPRHGTFGTRLAPLRVTGCVPDGLDAPHAAGPPASHDVALSFDDGPSEDTPRVLDILEAEQVPATFFEVGREIAGREATLRRIVADGDVIGDHTWSHLDLTKHPKQVVPQLASTRDAVARATGGYTPCLFRPPYGALDPAVVRDAAGLGLATVTWDVDPRDWSLPGTKRIVRTVLSETRPGSIILLHDGGGPREQTVAALPAIIRALRARGLRFVTVPQLLGFPPAYAP